ncbi:MAG: 16S rRNA (adenine(1518)-N(6)/adenine(1519)-N(6))-dimethyltransferase RsmA [Methanomassiliicoccales archaeon]|nr:16S rRNA (adenine(1518)-N(6)/adenine(1519)-N(6))-dimethyltransferase RsmA [Methanomassiliicoccales archaeon]
MKPSEIQAILTEYSVRPGKQKGQNFLIDERVANREVDYAGIEPDDVVLEIGPGLGMLTDRLITRAKRVVGIEFDPGLCSYLRERYGDRIDLIEGDALKIEFPDFDKMVSNIPYNISSPLIFKLLDHHFDRAIVMIQREFAERMIAKPDTDDYSRLTVNTYYRAECRVLEHVPRSRFWPEPEVDSAIVMLTPRPPPFRVMDEDLFFKLIDVLFQHRRKKISTILKMKRIAPGKVMTLPYVDLRVEALSPEQIGVLSDSISSLKE